MCECTVFRMRCRKNRGSLCWAAAGAASPSPKDWTPRSSISRSSGAFTPLIFELFDILIKTLIAQSPQPYAFHGEFAPVPVVGFFIVKTPSLAHAAALGIYQCGYTRLSKHCRACARQSAPCGARAGKGKRPSRFWRAPHSLWCFQFSYSNIRLMSSFSFLMLVIPFTSLFDVPIWVIS